jgi:plastocyanin
MRDSTYRRRLLRTVAAATMWLVALPAAAADPHAGHGPVVVGIGEFSFSPREATATEGDYVLFSWQGPDTNHSATADAGQTVAFDSDPGKPPEQVNHAVNDGYSVQLTTPGTYTYHCKVHATMTGKVTVLALPDSLKPQAPVPPTLTRVHVTPTRLCHQPHCAHAGVLVRFTVNEAVSMRASVRRLVGTRAVGKVIKEVDFSGPPGDNSQKLDLGRLRSGRYQLKLVAVDQSTGIATKPVLARVKVSR